MHPPRTDVFSVEVIFWKRTTDCTTYTVEPSFETFFLKWIISPVGEEDVKVAKLS